MSAKIEIKLLDFFNSKSFIKVVKEDLASKPIISIYGYSDETESEFVLSLDKSTAIKLSKVIRTEINKINE